MPRLLPRTDWYFARSFVVFFTGVLFAVLFLLVIGDLLQKTDEFIDYGTKSDRSGFLVLLMALQYYLTYWPAQTLQHALPLVFVLSGTLTVTFASIHNEFTVLRSSGVSMLRAVMPLVITSFVLGSLIQLGRDYYQPFLLRTANRVASEIKPSGAQPMALVLRDGDTVQSIVMGHFDMHEDRYIAHNLRIEVRDADSMFEGNKPFDIYSAWEAYLQPRTDVADAAADDTRELQWRPQTRGQIQRIRYRHTTLPWNDPLPTQVTPAMLERQILGTAVMTSADLRLLADEELDARLELYRRQSEPLTITALVMLVLVIVMGFAGRGRQTAYIGIIVAVLCCCGFYVVRSAFTGLGDAGALTPFAAAWLPGFSLGLGALLLARRLE